MGRPVEVVVSELHSAAARLQDAGQRLQDGLSSVDLETSQLLGTGWKGDAASAFSKAWEQWHGGAGQVVRGLQTMSQLMTVAGKEYAKTDEQAAGAVGASGQAVDGSGGAPGGSSGGDGATAAPGAQGASTGQQAPSLAQQMNLAPLSQIGQIGGQVASGVGQVGQVAAGLAQQAAQAAAGVMGQVEPDATENHDGRTDGAAPGGDASPAAPVEPPKSGPRAPLGSTDATEIRSL